MARPENSSCSSVITAMMSSDAMKAAAMIGMRFGK
jgi:hypothetical protein